MASLTNNKKPKTKSITNKNNHNNNNNTNNNPFSLHREGDDGITRRNPFPIIYEFVDNDNNEIYNNNSTVNNNGLQNQQQITHDDYYDTENPTLRNNNIKQEVEVITTPFQSNIIDKRTSNDIFYNHNLLSTTALTIARDIDGGRITKPLSQYNANLNNSNKRSSIASGSGGISNSSSSNIFQKTYRYGSKSISRSEFSKEMLGDSMIDGQIDPTKNVDNTEKDNDIDTNENYFIKTIKRTVLYPLYTYYNKYLASSTSNTYHQFHQQILLLTIVTILLYLSSPTLLEPYLSKPPEWSWTNVNDRHLDGRTCAMNYFIEKQAPDEYDPDYKEIVIDHSTSSKNAADKSKKKEKNNEKDDKGKNEQKKKFKKIKKKLKPAEIAPGGTYRTKGQVHVIGRFISSVADSFRSNITVHQHLIFAGVRDSGHLAEKAMIYWPPRGPHKTVVHVIAADEDDMNNKTNIEDDGNNDNDNNDPLQYEYLHEIENRFRSNGQVLIYDKHGIAGNVLENRDGEDDDDYNAAEDDEIRDIAKHIKTTDNLGNTMDISSIIRPFQDQYYLEEHPLVIPYLHVDGVKMEHQLEVLSSTIPLLQSRTIVAVGIEHAPDTDAFTLMSFFKNVGYKTFFLGSRQVARIDHLCQEILNDVLTHPSITPPEPSTLRMILNKLGMMELPVVDWKKLHDDAFGTQLMKNSNNTNTNHMPNRNVMSRRSYPPFFIALPAGLGNKEAMQIQHMYDLFGGYDSGGGQVKTANDRKAPGKK